MFNIATEKHYTQNKYSYHVQNKNGLAHSVSCKICLLQQSVLYRYVPPLRLKRRPLSIAHVQTSCRSLTHKSEFSTTSVTLKEKNLHVIIIYILVPNNRLQSKLHVDLCSLNKDEQVSLSVTIISIANIFLSIPFFQGMCIKKQKDKNKTKQINNIQQTIETKAKT